MTPFAPHYPPHPHLAIRRALRTVLGLLALACTTLATAQDSAANYPARSVKIIVGYAAGGPTDLVARSVAQKLQNSLGQPFVVENRPGAGSNLASEAVAAAAPDGYTLLMAAAPITMNAFTFKGLKFDVQKSYEPISLVMSAPSILAVHSSVPAKTLTELIALAKAQPGKLTYGSSGAGGSQHVAGELFKQRAGVDLIHVPYKGAAGAMADLMAGHISMAFMTSLSALPHMKDGRIRPIAVASTSRLPQLPDVPTFIESGLTGYESDSWSGLLAPAKTPPEIVAKLQREVAKALAAPDLREKLTTQGALVVGNTPAEFKAYIQQEVTYWSRAFKTINIAQE